MYQEYETVSTIAGDGNRGYKDGSTLSSQFNCPHGIACDSNGNIFVADRYNNRIRKISSNGIVSTIAGDGNEGYKDGSALSSQFHHLYGITCDSNGNIFVADTSNNRIRKISPNGIVSTIAGDGNQGYKDGSALSSQFYYPCGIACDSIGNIFVVESQNNRIRKISPSGIVSTIAGDGKQGYKDGSALSSQLCNPYGITCDSNGNIFVADSGNHRIRKISSNGIVSTIAGDGNRGYKDGSALSSQFKFPCEIACDSIGNIFVADSSNNRIRKISPNGIVSTIAGDGNQRYQNGSALSSQFNGPYGIALDSNGNIFVADTLNHRIRKISHKPVPVKQTQPTPLQNKDSPPPLSTRTHNNEGYSIQIHKLTETIKSKNFINEEQERMIKQIQTKMKEQEQTIDQLLQQIIQQQSENSNQRDQIDQFQQQIKQMQAQMDQLYQQIKQLQKENEQIKQQNEDLKKQLSSPSSTTQPPPTTPNKEEISEETENSFDFDDIMIGKVIGRGTFGIVYQCTINKKGFHGGTFAIKQITTNKSSNNSQHDKELIESFENEVKTLKSIDHPNIVPLIGSIQWNDSANGNVIHFGFITPLYDCSLWNYIDQQRSRFSVGNRWFSSSDLELILKPIVKGLDYLHSINIAHRDLKCENILVRLKYAISISSIYISDLGVAKTCEEGNTQASTISGTLGWMAPEILKAESKKYNPLQSDVFSFGMLIWELLSGIKPNRSVEDVLNCVIQPLPPLILNNNKIYSPFVDLFKKCTQIDPLSRPTSKQILQFINNL